MEMESDDCHGFEHETKKNTWGNKQDHHRPLGVSRIRHWICDVGFIGWLKGRFEISKGTFSVTCGTCFIQESQISKLQATKWRTNGWPLADVSSISPPFISYQKTKVLTFNQSEISYSIYAIYPSKIEWDLTNGPLSKLLELLDTQG